MTRVVIRAGLLYLRIEIGGWAEGRKLGTLNLPGTIKQYINLEVRILGLLALYGHIELV